MCIKYAIGESYEKRNFGNYNEKYEIKLLLVKDEIRILKLLKSTESGEKFK